MGGGGGDLKKLVKNQGGMLKLQIDLCIIVM